MSDYFSGEYRNIIIAHKGDTCHISFESGINGEPDTTLVLNPESKIGRKVVYPSSGMARTISGCRRFESAHYSLRLPTRHIYHWSANPPETPLIFVEINYE